MSKIYRVRGSTPRAVGLVMGVTGVSHGHRAGGKLIVRVPPRELKYKKQLLSLMQKYRTRPT